MKLRTGSRKAVICRGGPENGPFSAQAFTTFNKILGQNGIKISTICAISGSVPTALLGCTGDEEKLCKIWLNLTPEEVVGPHAYLKAGVQSALRHESLISNGYLDKLFRKHCDLNRIFSPEAISIKISAVDYLTGKLVIFSNKITEHKECLIDGALGSMALAPWFNSPVIPRAKELGLIDETHPDTDKLFLVDGAYGGDLFLEEVVRDEYNFDVIFIMDIHGLKPSRFNLEERNTWIHKLRRTTHLTINSRDKLALSLNERINEEIEIRDLLLKARALSSRPEDIDSVIKRINNGRLHLSDKHKAEVFMISNTEQEIPFNFANFSTAEVAHLMRAGHQAALRMAKHLELDTSGIKIIQPQ